MVLDVFMGAPGPLLRPPGLLWVGFGGALGVSGAVFLMISWSGEAFEAKTAKYIRKKNDDPLERFAVLLATTAASTT